MRRVINGYRYDTAKATLVLERERGARGDLDWWEEQLYRSPRGNWFVTGVGGPRSRWAHCHALLPIDSDEALAWLEDDGTDDATSAIEQYFSEEVSDA